MPGMSLTVRRRTALFLTLLMGMLGLLAGRIAWIQFAQGEKLSAKVRGQLQESRLLLSPRGAIYDRSGRELAVSNLSQSLYASPKDIKDPATMANMLAPILEMKPEELRQRLTGGGSFVWVKRTLDHEQAEQVTALIKDASLSGLGFIEESKRYYPNNTLAAQILGFVGTDDIGLEGMEAALDKTIKGKQQEQVIDTDNRGIPIFKSIFAFTPRKQVQSVYLTIDSGIQYIVEKALDNAMANTKARAATAIVMNPKTGEVLAMANRPTYNPNQFYRYDQDSWKNRAVSFVYEPGSTFKAVVAAAALEEGLVQPEERFIDNGDIEVSGRHIQNWSGDSYGNVSFLDIIKNSINTGFVQIGMRVGAGRLTNYVRTFGFGTPTGIELPGEEAGLLFDPREMRDSDLATMSIGQSIAVTPLQLLTAMSAIANDGVLLKPHIIKEIRNADGTLAEITGPQSVRQVIRSETARILTALLEKVVSEGGGDKAAVKGYHFAGKTGTAEKLNPDGRGYMSGHYIASFAGFGPVEDPQLAAIIVLDDPSGIYYGGTIAAPVFSEIMSQLLRYLNIRPLDGKDLLPLPKQNKSQPAVALTPPVTREVPPGKVLVPDLTGKPIREVGETLNKLGLTFTPAGSGIAVRQNISANTAVDPGTEVVVYFEQR
ncbi:penicillin-binding protein [Methylomusa anaerophila]|uniref:Stage V sporulation protein D n=1 Tax=Methylomusa anaerophila TaxID=1930071 RepID=A0A348AI80_9FIRM|nr:penicillin-binding transpeptidase domain-containing protein [Methylomusa anaerophila]BBB90778.1 stage V sporulation protein D [Methylomusa anaerophila]